MHGVRFSRKIRLIAIPGNPLDNITLFHMFPKHKKMSFVFSLTLKYQFLIYLILNLNFVKTNLWIKLGRVAIRCAGSFGTTIPSTRGPNLVENFPVIAAALIISLRRFLRRHVSNNSSSTRQFNEFAIWYVTWLENLVANAQSESAVPLIKITRLNNTEEEK